jgi:hypothetical protein
VIQTFDRPTASPNSPPISRDNYILGWARSLRFMVRVMGDRANGLAGMEAIVVAAVAAMAAVVAVVGKG